MFLGAVSFGVRYWGKHTNVIAQTFCELSVRAGQSVCAKHKSKRHYVPRRKPACAKVSEEKRRTVWAEVEFSTFSERAHPAGRLGTFSLDFLLHTFLVSRQEKYVGLGKAQEKILCFAQITCNGRNKKGRTHGFAPTDTCIKWCCPDNSWIVGTW